MPEVAMKRPADMAVALVDPKKARANELAITSRKAGALVSAPARTSSLLSPIMLLSGHESEVYSAAFHPEGNWLASAGHDRQILLWDTYGDCQNFAMLTGHSGAILQLAFSVDGSSLVAASTDRTVGLFDTRTGVRLKRMKGHASFVNACATTSRGTDLVCSGSDDGTVRVWDPRRRLPVHVLENGYPVTSVAFNDTAEQIFSAGIDNDIKVWDLRGATPAPSLTLRGHVDTVTSLALSKDGAYLLSNSMDKTLRCWDVRPFAPQERCIRLFQGHQHGFEKNLIRCCWSPDGKRVVAGSSDRFVYVWDVTSRRILYKLPGHQGSVNDVGFHPEEPILLTASSDKTVYLGELEA